MNRHIIIYILTCGCLFLYLPDVFPSKEISITHFGIEPNNGKDATLAVRNAINYCSEKKINKLIFPKGKYDFYPKLATEKTVYISNNTDGEKRITFSIDNMKNFEIDGGGATFIFHGYICPFVIKNCKNIILNNFSIDFSRTFHSEGIINAVHKDEIEVYFPEKYPFKIENERLIFTDGKKIEYPYGSLLEYNTLKKETAYQVHDYYTGPVLKAENIGQRQVRIHLKDVKGTPGNTMVFAPNHRLCPAITIDNTQDINIANITLYHCGGMGVIAQRSKNITVNKIKVTAAQGRTISCTADATHFANCEGKIILTDCLFENQMDDATNIHGIYMRIEKILSSTSLLLRLVHYEQYGMDIFKKGQKVELVNAQTVETYSINNVESVKRYNKEFYQVEFKENLPSALKEKDVVGSAIYPEVILKNCICQNNRARGVLLGSRTKIIVEGNRFHTPGAAIMTGGDTEYWFEQGGVSNLEIKNNIFDNCNYGVWGDAAIQIAAGSKDKGNSPRFNHNIIIENNIFNVFDPRILKVSSVDGLIFRHNKINHSTAYPAIHTTAKPFNIENSTNINIQK